MTPEQFEKLPKWAQKEWADREREIKAFKEHARKVLDGQTVTKVCVDHYDNPKFIQSDTVYFRFSDTNSIEVRMRDDRLEIRATGNLSDTLAITPKSCNGIELRAEEWKRRSDS